MKTNTIILALLLAISGQLKSQETQDRLDIRVGTGISILGSGDMRTYNYENEINYKLNQYLTSSLSAAFGKSTNGVFEASSFIQWNLNCYVSPFKNTKKNDFRLGVGLSFYNISDTYEKPVYIENGQLVNFEQRSSFGYNLIIENSTMITNRVLIGFKLFMQPYFNGDMNSGAMLKLGFKI